MYSPAFLVQNFVQMTNSYYLLSLANDNAPIGRKSSGHRDLQNEILLNSPDACLLIMKLQ